MSPSTKADAKHLYREMLQQGHRRHSLKKRVSDLISTRYGKKGSTVDKLWPVLDAERSAAERSAGRMPSKLANRKRRQSA